MATILLSSLATLVLAVAISLTFAAILYKKHTAESAVAQAEAIVLRHLLHDIIRRQLAEHMLYDASLINRMESIDSYLTAAKQVHDLDGLVSRSWANHAFNAADLHVGGVATNWEAVANLSKDCINTSRHFREVANSKEGIPYSIVISHDDSVRTAWKALVAASKSTAFATFVDVERQRANSILIEAEHYCWILLSRYHIHRFDGAAAAEAAQEADSLSQSGAAKNQRVAALFRLQGLANSAPPRFRDSTTDSNVDEMLKFIHQVEQLYGESNMSNSGASTALRLRVTDRDLYVARHNCAVVYSLNLARLSGETRTSWLQAGKEALFRAFCFGGYPAFQNAHQDDDLAALLGRSRPAAEDLDGWVALLCDDVANDKALKLRKAFNVTPGWWLNAERVTVRTVADTPETT